MNQIRIIHNFGKSKSFVVGSVSHFGTVNFSVQQDKEHNQRCDKRVIKFYGKWFKDGSQWSSPNPHRPFFSCFRFLLHPSPFYNNQGVLIDLVIVLLLSTSRQLILVTRNKYKLQLQGNEKEMSTSQYGTTVGPHMKFNFNQEIS